MLQRLIMLLFLKSNEYCLRGSLRSRQKYDQFPFDLVELSYPSRVFFNSLLYKNLIKNTSLLYRFSTYETKDLPNSVVDNTPKEWLVATLGAGEKYCKYSCSQLRLVLC